MILRYTEWLIALGIGQAFYFKNWDQIDKAINKLKSNVFNKWWVHFGDRTEVLIFLFFLRLDLKQVFPQNKWLFL